MAAILAALGLPGHCGRVWLRRGRRNQSGGGHAKAVALVLLLGIFASCQNQAAQLQPQLVAGDAAVVSAKVLYTTGELPANSARKLSVDCHILDGGFKAALAAINANQPPAAVTATQILATLDAIALDLQTTPKAKALAAAIKQKTAALRASGARSWTR